MEVDCERDQEWEGLESYFLRFILNFRDREGGGWRGKKWQLSPMFFLLPTEDQNLY